MNRNFSELDTEILKFRQDAKLMTLQAKVFKLI